MHEKVSTDSSRTAKTHVSKERRAEFRRKRRVLKAVEERTAPPWVSGGERRRSGYSFLQASLGQKTPCGREPPVNRCGDVTVTAAIFSVRPTILTHAGLGISRSDL